MNTTRLLAALLAVSLAGHATWFLRASRPTPPHPPAAAAPGASTAQTSVAAPGPAAPSAETVSTFSRALSSPSLTEFRDLLVAAGIEPKLRREMLQLLLQHRYADRFHAVYTDNADIAQGPWWRNPDYRAFNSPAVQRERQRVGQQLQQAFDAELAELTGEDPRALNFEDNPWLERQYASLPPEKADALHRLRQDYEELEQQVRAESMDFPLPGDQEKLRLLQAERDRDIAALLTPEERALWEMRASPSADRAREHATRYEASEEEYRRIFALQKTFDDAFEFDPFTSGTGADLDWEAREDARKALENGIRAIIGDERYLAAQREADQDLVLARAAADRLGLPPESAERLSALRAPAVAESQRIAVDPTLNPDQKKTALARLAADSRAELERTLGPEAAAVYLERGGMGWLKTLENGSAVGAVDSVGPDTITPAPALIQID